MATASDLQRQMAALTGLAERDLRLLLLEVEDLASMGVALNDILPILIDTYGHAASAITADWYDERREQVGPRGRFAAIPAPMPNNTGAGALVGWAESEAHSPESMLQLALGGMQRRIADQSRATVIGSVGRDPSARGWMRVGDAANCGFCDLLISRGAVYSADSVKFGAHDNCNCGAAPSWGRPSDVFDVDAYRSSQRRARLKERDPEQYARENATARAWVADNLIEV